MINKDNEEYLTTEEACAILRVSRRTIERYTNAGRIKKYRRGIRNVVYKRSEVEKLRDELLTIRPEENSEGK
jgi:excisionase family DNA binding protein